jgi:valyl-tRNA synthetase
MIPPPNVTGTLHMGHAFQDTIMDALIRYHRMRGRNTLWQPGTDHAGIATQMVVERQLECRRQDTPRPGPRGLHRTRLGMEGGIRRHHHPAAARMGASVDWSPRALHHGRRAVRRGAEVFVRLYEEGLIYRGKRLVNWDPVLHTAVSDLEVVSEEEDGPPLAHALPPGRRLRPRDRGHHPAGDHAG